MNFIYGLYATNTAKCVPYLYTVIVEAVIKKRGKTSENTQLNLLMVVQRKRKGVANMTDVVSCLFCTYSKVKSCRKNITLLSIYEKFC
jgi:hypothetical protein